VPTGFAKYPYEILQTPQLFAADVKAFADTLRGLEVF
jgi:hypothetical protein